MVLSCTVSEIRWLIGNGLFLLHLCYPSHSAPSVPMFPLEFRAEVDRQETILMGLSSSEDRMIVAGDFLAWYQRVTDGRSDGQTESIIANTALCIASYAAVICTQLVWYYVFSARQHICYSALYAIVRPSVRPSVCHTGGSVKDGWS